MLTVFIVFWGICWYKNKMFKKTTYYKITKYSFKSIVRDRGRYGEYLIYKNLKSYEDSGGKFLFNCYLPKDDGTTTEIDVILINEDGVFCFESKNYSGWIFGDEKSRNWTQILPKGKGGSHKEHFLNPIIQNKLHIKWLKKQIDENIPVHSIIVFSQICTLKKVTIENPNIHVINRPRIVSTVKEVAKVQSEKLTFEMINKIYDSLYPYTQVTDVIKLQHIENIKKKVMEKSNLEINGQSHVNKIKKEGKEIIQEQGEARGNDSRICPKCGNQLIIRTAKRGDSLGKQFYGCTSYPKCRFIRNL